MVAAFLLLLGILLSCGLPQEVAGQVLTQSGLLYFSFVSNNTGNFSTTPLSTLPSLTSTQTFQGANTFQGLFVTDTSHAHSSQIIASSTANVALTLPSTPGTLVTSNDIAAMRQYLLGTFTTGANPAAITVAQTSGAALSLTASSTNLTVSSTPGASSTVWTMTISASGQATENLPYSVTTTMQSSGSVTGPIGATSCVGFNANGAYVDTPFTCTNQFAFILSGGTAWFSVTTDLLSPSGYVSVVQIA